MKNPQQKSCIASDERAETISLLASYLAECQWIFGDKWAAVSRVAYAEILTAMFKSGLIDPIEIGIPLAFTYEKKNKNRARLVLAVATEMSIAIRNQ